MKIFMIASKHLYDKVEQVKNELELQGHIITPPNSYDDPFKEERLKKQSLEKHKQFKKEMFDLQKQKVTDNDAVLVLNYEKKGQSNYIGGATLLEIYEAFMQNKKIFFMNPIPNNPYYNDELKGFNPTILNQDLEKII